MVDSQFGNSKATGDVEDSTYVIVVAKTRNIYLIQNMKWKMIQKNQEN